MSFCDLIGYSHQYSIETETSNYSLIPTANGLTWINDTNGRELTAGAAAETGLPDPQSSDHVVAANNWQTAGLGFAGFNMQKTVAAKTNGCTGAFHSTTLGTAVQFGSLTALSPLNSNYGANWYQTLSFGSLKAAFVGGIKGGSAYVGEAIESAISAVATPALLTATGIDTNVTAVCAGSAVSASVPVP